MNNSALDYIESTLTTNVPQIIFEGALSKQSKLYLRNKYCKKAILTFGIGAFLFCVPLWMHGEIFYTIFACVCFAISLGIGYLVGCISVNIPTKIEFDNNNIYITYLEATSKQVKETSRDFEDVSGIIDLGFAYYIKIGHPRVFVSCICQKDLLIKGTVDEFEKLFNNDISAFK